MYVFFMYMYECICVYVSVCAHAFVCACMFFPENIKSQFCLRPNVENFIFLRELKISLVFKVWALQFSLSPFILIPSLQASVKQNGHVIPISFTLYSHPPKSDSSLMDYLQCYLLLDLY